MSTGSHVILAVALVSMALSGLVVWFSMTTRRDHGPHNINYVRNENWTRLLQALSRPDDVLVDENLDTNNSLIRRHFWWLAGTHTIENYFAHGHFVNVSKYHSRYTHSTLTLLPYFPDHGGEFSSCLKRTGLLLNMALGPEMTYRTRHAWDTSSDKKGAFRFKHKYKLLSGWAALGTACVPLDTAGSGMGVTSTPCGHALIMQHPLSLAISEYGQCLLDPNSSPTCGSFHEGHVSIEDWVVSRGSVVFKSLIFNSIVCEDADSTGIVQNTEGQSTFQPRHVRYQDDGGRDSCALRHQAKLDTLEPEAIRVLLDFIVENVSNLFSVVGVYEDLLSSLTLLHHVFRLPLHECDFATRFKERTPPSHASVDYINDFGGTHKRTKTGQIRSSKLLTYRHQPAGRDLDFPSLSLPVKTSNDELSADISYHIPHNNDTDYDEDEDDYDGEMVEGDDVIHNDFSRNGILSDHVWTYRSRLLLQNRADDRLYSRLVNDKRVMHALAYDLKIFEAVKMLHTKQKRLYYNVAKGL